jgi:hypothetical protein
MTRMNLVEEMACGDGTVRTTDVKKPHQMTLIAALEVTH